MRGKANAMRCELSLCIRTVQRGEVMADQPNGCGCMSLFTEAQEGQDVPSVLRPLTGFQRGIRQYGVPVWKRDHL